MSKTFKPNFDGFVKLRNSDGVVAELERKAAEIAERAGEGFETRPAERNYKGDKARARVAVVTASFSARYREASDGILRRALEAGRR